MAYKIIDIQGIGEAYAPKLIAIGIKTPDELLEACLTPAAGPTRNINKKIE